MSRVAIPYEPIPYQPIPYQPIQYQPIPYQPMPYQRHPDVCAAELDGEICLFHPQTARYLALNATGSAIWQLLDRPMDLKGLVSALRRDFEVEEGTCDQHTRAFLGEAVACGMLQEAPEP